MNYYSCSGIRGFFYLKPKLNVSFKRFATNLTDITPILLFLIYPRAQDINLCAILLTFANTQS